MPALQPVITTQEEIQGVALFIDGAGVAFVAFALTSGARIKVYKVVGVTATPLEDAIPPANSGVYMPALQGTGADLVVTGTGHYFTEKPRNNVLWQARYAGVVTPSRADPYHGAGAFLVEAPAPPPVVPPVVPPPGADPVSVALSALMQASCTAALKAGGLVK
jgi:hypothetical protein